MANPFPVNLEDFEDGEPLMLGKIRIPRYGSLLYDEREVLKDLEDTSYLSLATLLLQSRFNPEWTESETRKLPHHLIRAAAEFLINEANQWEEPEADSNPKKSGIPETSTGGSD